MKNNDLISIIVPVFKVERYLKRCIDSILAQTYKNFELILVDDGSPDSCPKICDEYAAKDGRVRVIHKTNGGAASARNAGIDAAKGTYIGFVDGDDLIAPQMYEKLMSALVQNDADFSICNFCYADKSGKKTRQGIFYPLKDEIVTPRQIQDGWEMFYNKSALISPCNKIYRASVWSSLRYPEGMLAEDSYIMPQLYHGHKVACIADTMYYYTQHRDSVMGAASVKITKDTITASWTAINFYEEHNYASEFVTSKFEDILWRLGEYANRCSESQTSEGKAFYGQTLAGVRTMLNKRDMKNVPLKIRFKLWLEAASPRYAYKFAEILGRTRKY